MLYSVLMNDKVFYEQMPGTRVSWHVAGINLSQETGG